MRILVRFGGVIGAAALMLAGPGMTASAEASAVTAPAAGHSAVALPPDGGLAESPLDDVLPGSIALQPTLEQRRAGRGRGGGAVSQRSGSGRRAVPRAGRAGRGAGRPVRGGRTVVVNRRYYSPYYGYGYPYGYGYWGYPYPYFDSYYGYYGGSYSYTGSVRLRVKPRHAEVLVDGYYVGTVDDFDGIFQSLKLEPGPANIEIRSPGFESLALNVRILPGRKITYEANMRAGDPGPPPAPAAASRRILPRQADPNAIIERRQPGEAPPPDAQQQLPPERSLDYDQQPPLFGGVRLRVDPKDAQVFVDGLFVGTVDDFDGGKGLPLESGPQNIEIRADGYQPLTIQVRILPDETITYEGQMDPVSRQ